MADKQMREAFTKYAINEGWCTADQAQELLWDDQSWGCFTISDLLSCWQAALQSRPHPVQHGKPIMRADFEQHLAEGDNSPLSAQEKCLIDCFIDWLNARPAPVVTDEMVERAARAINAQEQCEDSSVPFAAYKQYYLRLARAALTAALAQEGGE